MPLYKTNVIKPGPRRISKSKSGKLKTEKENTMSETCDTPVRRVNKRSNYPKKSYFNHIEE